jgi:NADH-quinone oxidoreductase subunit L
MALLTAGMTAFYMTRLWMMTFSGPIKRTIEEMVPAKDHSTSGNWVLKKRTINNHSHEAPLIMTFPLMVLALLAVISGFSLFVGEGFGGKVYYGSHHSSDNIIQWSILDHILSSSLTYLSVLIGLTGVSLGYLFYKRDATGDTVFSTNFVSKNIVTKNLHVFLYNRMYMAKLFDWFGMRTWDTFAAICDWFDRRIIDGIVNFMAFAAQEIGEIVRKSTSGFTGHYASLSIGGLGLLVVITRIVMPLMGWSI